MYPSFSKFIIKYSYAHVQQGGNRRDRAQTVLGLRHRQQPLPQQRGSQNYFRDLVRRSFKNIEPGPQKNKQVVHGRGPELGQQA